MKSYLLAALVAMPAFALAAPEANAGGCRGQYCGGGGHQNGHHGYPQEYFVHIPTLVSDRPAPGYTTRIYVRAGTKVTAVCDQYDWCRIHSGRYANLHVPKYCLESVAYDPYPRHRRSRDEFGWEKRERHYGGAAVEERYYEENGRNGGRYSERNGEYNGERYRNGGY